MQYGLENIRNVVLLSHSGAGKTSLTEVALFDTGTISRLGKVEDGSTTSDYDPDEIKRRISINLKLLPLVWKDTKLNFIDTPGYIDFVGEVKAAVRVADGAIIVVSAASGVEVGTEQVWDYAGESNLSRLIVVNKMDRENVNFARTVEQIQAKFGKKCVALHLPIGSQSDFQGVVDLLNLKAYTGTQGKEEAVPAAMQEQVKYFREKLVEAVAETDDKLIEKYLGGEELTQGELSGALRKAVVNGQVVPILASSALLNIGTTPLMDAIKTYLPAPKEREVLVLGADKKTVEKVAPSETAPLAALVFKTSADPYVGKLTYFRVYMGVIDSNSQVWNASRNGVERVGQLYVLRGKTQETVPQLRAGDIGAVAKLNITVTGDTLGSKDKPLHIVPPVFPEPIFSKAVYPKTKADLDKLGAALTRIVEEDPTLRMRRETDTAETIISGLGETHVDVSAERMLRKFGVNVEMKTPKVPYKETITVGAKAEHKHKKQTGGHGQYGHAMLELEAVPRDSGYEFVDRTVGGSIPRNYIPAVEKGVIEGMKEGVLAGYPVVDVRVAVYDGSFHPVDSSEICFKIAGEQALKKGLSAGNPVLLEPIMKISVRVPDSYTGDILSDLNTKRARVHGMNPENGYNVIEAEAPLAEVQRYAIDLKSITQGKGSYTMSFSHYEQAPSHITQKIIAERQAERAEKAAEKA